MAEGQKKDIPVLAYWKIRGLAQPVRLLLNYVGEEFEDKHYVVGPPPDFKRDAWTNEKFTLGLDFPNLPYFIDGDIKITQSNAILRYIARKHDLCGKNEKERVLVDVMENVAMDFRNGAVRLFYNPQFANLKAGYLAELKNKLAGFEKFLDGKKFFAGDRITFVDFPIYETLDHHRILDPECLKEQPNLSAFMDRFEELPAIKAYMASDKFMSHPLNNRSASFGNN